VLRDADPTPNSGDRLTFSTFQGEYDLLHFRWNAGYWRLLSSQVARFGAAQALGDAPEICFQGRRPPWERCMPRNASIGLLS